MKKRIVFSLAILCLVFLTAAALWDVQTMFCSTSYDGLHTGEITLAGDFFSMELDTASSAPLFRTCRYEISGNAMYLTIYTSLLWGDNWPRLVSIRDAALADVETVYLRDGDRTKSIYSVS